MSRSVIRADFGRPLAPAFAIVGFREQGVLVSEASVPASYLFRAGRVFAEVNSTARTGIVLVNTSIQAQIDPPAVVSFLLHGYQWEF